MTRYTQPANSPLRSRLPLLALSLLMLVLASWAGLLRLGWQWPLIRPTLPMAHGPLMVSGFLGALICLERGIALVPVVQGKARILLLLPSLLAGLGGLVVAMGILNPLGPILMTLGSLGLVALMTRIYRLHPAFYSLVIWLGAVAWAGGQFLWLFGQPVYAIIPWWTGFLALTIAGERLELSRLLRLPPRTRRLFMLAIVLLGMAMLLTLLRYDMGMRVLGLALLLLAAWLLRYDIARRRLHVGGQTRFIAVALLSGYGWLGISGALFIIYGGMAAGPYYDAMLHTFFLGYVMSMIFAHAPIVFPAVLGRPLPFTPWFYSHLGLLHASLLLRIAGDLALQTGLRQWGGLLNALVLLLFLLNTVVAIRRGQSRA